MLEPGDVVLQPSALVREACILWYTATCCSGVCKMHLRLDIPCNLELASVLMRRGVSAAQRRPHACALATIV